MFALEKCPPYRVNVQGNILCTARTSWWCPSREMFLLFPGLKQPSCGLSVYHTANSEESESEFQPYDDNVKPLALAEIA